VEEHGGSKLTRLNRAHLLAPAVLDLAQVRARLIALLKAEISTWALPPLHASLFGSAARGDGTTASDLDILVLRSDNVETDDEPWASQILDSGLRIRRATGNEVSWFDVITTHLHRAITKKEPLISEWRRDAIQLAGQGLRTVLTKAS
jgi:predicted nucleotidyltransferase